MKLHVYVRPEIIAWLILTSVGTAVSLLSGHEMAAGIQAIQRVALRRPHAEDVLRMAQHDLFAEYARTVAQALFLFVGLVALVSRPPLTLRRPRTLDRIVPWVFVLVEGILVGNSVNEYVLSRRVLKRRADIQTRSTQAAADQSQ